jgi:hypothetical protein
MGAKVVIEDKAAHAAWIASQTPMSVAANTAPATKE